MRREGAAACPFAGGAVVLRQCGTGNSFLARRALWYAIRKFVFRCSEAKGAVLDDGNAEGGRNP